MILGALFIRAGSGVVDGAWGYPYCFIIRDRCLWRVSTSISV